MAASEETQKRDPRQLSQLALTAWEMEQEPVGAGDARSRSSLLRAHARLQAEIEAVTGIVADQRSRLRVRDDAEEGVLLIHGSTGSPADLAGLAEHLFDSGFQVYSMLLPGHGTGTEGLPTVMWKSCLNEVSLRYRILSRACRRVHVVGFSFGAALAILLTQNEHPSTLSLLAPALVPKVTFWTRLMIALGLHRLPVLRRRIGWNLEVFEAMEKAKGQIGKLKLPVYAAHCEDDERIDAASLRHLQKKVHNKSSRFRLYQTGGHMILEAHGPSSLHGEVLQFIRTKPRQHS
ncbi:alpha/beta fold hydrolase [bacterium]|nr:alpha/beta fold hydrolase [bacterium]MBU1072046.1 alpha/beta fold hydrolase [bacterium]MBU1676278.1 alpha/beta fold hydrolase [bacterium]